MSTIAEKARLEGDAAEAENPDEPTPEEVEAQEAEEAEEAEPEPEPEPEPEGRSGVSPQAKFQRAFAAFVKKAAECFEVLPADIQVAPHPGVVGIMLPGFTEPRTHDNFTTCLTCNGIGKVLTGANTGDVSKDLATCPDSRCKGNGYWAKAQTQAPPTGPLAPTAPTAPVAGGEWGEAPAWLGDTNITPGQ